MNAGFFRRCHWWVGFVGLLLFVLSGQYMMHVLKVPLLDDGPRMVVRASHIYFMCACALNFVLGCHMATGSKLSWLATLASLLMLLAPIILLYSFFFEASSGGLDKSVGVFGLFALFGAAGLLCLNQLTRSRF